MTNEIQSLSLTSYEENQWKLFATTKMNNQTIQVRIPRLSNIKMETSMNQEYIQAGSMNFVYSNNLQLHITADILIDKNNTYIYINEGEENNMKINLYESYENFKLYVLVPGLQKDQVKLVYQKDELIIMAAGNPIQVPEGAKKICHEFNLENMERKIYVPDVDQNNITASVVGGVLVINLPKLEQGKVINIE
jgi:HSP20 family molecular chaperone IbpA